MGSYVFHLLDNFHSNPLILDSASKYFLKLVTQSSSPLAAVLNTSCYYTLLYCTSQMLALSTNWRQNTPPAKRLWLALFSYSLYCGGWTRSESEVWLYKLVISAAACGRQCGLTLRGIGSGLKMLMIEFRFSISLLWDLSRLLNVFELQFSHL